MTAQQGFRVVRSARSWTWRRETGTCYRRVECSRSAAHRPELVPDESLDLIPEESCDNSPRPNISTAGDGCSKVGLHSVNQTGDVAASLEIT